MFSGMPRWLSQASPPCNLLGIVGDETHAYLAQAKKECLECLEPGRVEQPRLSTHRDFFGASVDACFGEGFRTPALCRTVVGVLGPAFESLPRRKPRAGRGAVFWARSMGI
jgi:hypothetical protein